MNTDTRLIPLTQGKFTIVSACDYDWLMQWKWYIHKIKKEGGYIWYARRRNWPEGKTIYMHREVAIKSELPHSKRYDHKDRDGLNNTRANLRPCTQSQNNANKSKSPNKTSRFKGVSWDSRECNWCVQVKLGRKRVYQAYFGNEEEAALAYNEAALKFFGEFATLNTI